jgi:amino-acid N-acetyltransferase
MPEPAVAHSLEELARGGARAVLLVRSSEHAEKLGAVRTVRASDPRFEAEVWRAFQSGPRVAVITRSGPFDRACVDLALRLGVFKLVWLDPAGGLRARGGATLSFVHLDELRQLLSAPAENLHGTERLSLWSEIAVALERGLAAVNVCAPGDLDDELFTYAGSGTLFTRERYMSVRPLGIDDFDTAADLIARGVDEGYLVSRAERDVDQVLACGFGAFVEGRDLAGIGALVPGGDGRSGEIASLYALTRYLGEGVGFALVAYALEQALAQGFEYVFACTMSERVGSFFERNGFARVDPSRLPDAKWRGYDAERKRRVLCYRKGLSAPSVPPAPAP